MLDKELGYVGEARALIEAGAKRTPRPESRLLPHSSRREAWHAWPLLYDEVLTQVTSAEYASTVEARLELRASCGNPKPYFVGFAVMQRDGSPDPRGLWQRPFDELQRKSVRDPFGRDRVHRRAAVARTYGSRLVRIASVPWKALE